MSNVKSRNTLNNGDKMVTTTYEFGDLPTHMRRPDKKTVGQFLFDSKSGEILGRTPANWGKLLLFYVIFYIILAALFAICMQGLFSTLSNDYPKWKLEESIIGTNPGVGFRPILKLVERGSLISYNATNSKEVEEWVQSLDEFLKPYAEKVKLENGKTRKLCSFENPPKPDEVCAVEITNWKPCVSADKYSYNKAAPCIFVKLNRIFSWEPEYYNNLNELPEDMPATLKQHITNLTVAERDQVWISCEGEQETDKLDIVDIKYVSGQQGFPSYYYPFKNNAGYLSPLIPVQIIVKPNRNVNVECRAWAKNIKYFPSIRDRQGSIHLEIMVDA